MNALRYIDSTRLLTEARGGRASTHASRSRTPSRREGDLLALTKFTAGNGLERAALVGPCQAAHEATLGSCSGYAPLGCEDGYASSDIFFLETCFYSMMCSNHDELFELGVGEDFNCELSRPGFERLRNYILAREHSSWW